MTTVGTPLMWAGFLLFVAVMLALDLGIFNRTVHTFTAAQALRWTGVWVSLGALFGAGMWWFFGATTGVEFLTGWVIEYSLSVDNLFVFILVFRAFQIPNELQHRVLFWGIVGALVLRVSMILAGAVLVARFHWILYVFGAFLLWSGLKILWGAVGGGGAEEEEHPEQNPLVRAIARILPTSRTLHGAHFFVAEGGKRLVTPLFICLITVEISDVVFAVDSIPAIFAITTDPFVVFTSNIFAIMGLRSLFFLLQRWVGLFRFLETGLGIVLSFVGGKMLVDYFGVHLHPAVSLGTVIVVLAGSIVLSILIKAPEEPAPPPAPPA